jgi:hypothetical protein
MISRRDVLKGIPVAAATVLLPPMALGAPSGETPARGAPKGPFFFAPPGLFDRKDDVAKLVQWLDVFLTERPTVRQLDSDPFCGDERIAATLKRFGFEMDVRLTTCGRRLQDRENGESLYPFVAAITTCGWRFLMHGRHWCAWPQADLPADSRPLCLYFRKYQFGPPADATIIEKIYYGDAPEQIEYAEAPSDWAVRLGMPVMSSQLARWNCLTWRVLEELQAAGTSMEYLNEWRWKASLGEIWHSGKYLFQRTDWREAMLRKAGVEEAPLPEHAILSPIV